MGIDGQEKIYTKKNPGSTGVVLFLQYNSV